MPFTAKMTVKRDEEFAEMFAQCWRSLSDHFYDPKHHGADWTRGARASTCRWSGTSRTQEDLYALVSLMLGELNASHLGISGKLPTPDESTADLGLIFDDTYTRPGAEGRRGAEARPGRQARAAPQARRHRPRHRPRRN